MKIRKFRVWNDTAKKYEERFCSISKDGKLMIRGKWVSESPAIYKIEFSTGFIDKAGEEIYENSDILKPTMFPEDTGGEYVIIFHNGSYRKKLLSMPDEILAPLTQEDINLLEDKIICSTHDLDEVKK